MIDDHVGERRGGLRVETRLYGSLVVVGAILAVSFDPLSGIVVIAAGGTGALFSNGHRSREGANDN